MQASRIAPPAASVPGHLPAEPRSPRDRSRRVIWLIPKADVSRFLERSNRDLDRSTRRSFTAHSVAARLTRAEATARR